MNDKDKLAAMEAEMARLEPMRSRYYAISQEASKLREKIRTQKKRDDLYALSSLCQYVEPIYPDMGKESVDGEAFFANEEDANKLAAALRLQSYTYGYEVEWEGPGLYRVVPSWTRDYDNDITYLATFKKGL